MGYTVAGEELEADADGYLLEPDYSEEVVSLIAAAEGIELMPKHWEVVNYMREEYREHGHTPNFRTNSGRKQTARRCMTCSRLDQQSRRQKSPDCPSLTAKADTD